MPDVSLLATLVATMLGFVLGALWYGPLFGKTWMAATGLTPDQIRSGFNPARINCVSAVRNWVRRRSSGFSLSVFDVTTAPEPCLTRIKPSCCNLR